MKEIGHLTAALTTNVCSMCVIDNRCVGLEPWLGIKRKREWPRAVGHFLLLVVTPFYTA